MRRRDLIILIGGAAAAWPLAAGAQQKPVIGYLSTEVSALLVFPAYLRTFRQGLAESGFVDGQNVSIEYRSADGQTDRLPGLAAELVRQRVAVIQAQGIAAALAAKSATQTIPIVFATGGDPVKLGLVASFNRPGGNVTGIVGIGNLLAPKQLEVLHELVPTASSIAFLVNANNPNTQTDVKNLQTAAAAAGLHIFILKVGTAAEIDNAFETLIGQHSGALLVQFDALFQSQVDRIAALGISHSIPVAAAYREFASAGGLMSYGSNDADNERLRGNYAGRILRGEKPADLPVIQPTKFELVINLKTARAISLTVPPLLLALADDVIE